MSNLNEYYLEKLGITVWRTRQIEDIQAVEEEVSATEIAVPETFVPLQEIAEEHAGFSINHCTRCNLCNHRESVILGKGDKNAKIAIILDAPTVEEDLSKITIEPNYLKILTGFLALINLSIEDVYLTHYVKCYGAKTNEDVEMSEKACLAYLKEEIDEISANLIVVLGRNSANFIVNEKQPFDVMRGKLITDNKLNKPLLVSYGLPHIFNFPKDRQKMWQDFKKIYDLLAV